MDDPLGVKGTYITAIAGDILVGFYYQANGRVQGFIKNGTAFTTVDYPNDNFDTYLTNTDGSRFVGYYGALPATHGFVYDGSTFTPFEESGASSPRRPWGLMDEDCR